MVEAIFVDDLGKVQVNPLRRSAKAQEEAADRGQLADLACGSFGYLVAHHDLSVLTTFQPAGHYLQQPTMPGCGAGG